MPERSEGAIAHVASLATGQPVDPSWRVTLHFHPDRLMAGVPILDLMARDGVYRSQFETGTSNGGLDGYIEAQGHGVLDPARDVQTPGPDPRDRHTPVDAAAGPPGLP